MKQLNNTLKAIKKFGLICTAKLILRHLGTSRLKVYQSFRYPLTNYQFKVIFRNNAWINLENGKIELKTIKFLIKLVKPGDDIMDIGAWDGTFTLLLSKLVGVRGKVYAFDPDEKAFNNLKNNIRKNKLNNVNIEKVGLSNSVGTKIFHLIKGGGASQSTIVFHKKGYRTKFLKTIKKQIINITTIDKYCEERNIQPKGIKMDVEGAEKLVIEGGLKTIKKNNLWILMEFHGLLMPENMRKDNWNKIVKSAKKVIFIDGKTHKYHSGMELKEMPDCNYFHIFIQF